MQVSAKKKKENALCPSDFKIRKSNGGDLFGVPVVSGALSFDCLCRESDLWCHLEHLRRDRQPLLPPLCRTLQSDLEVLDLCHAEPQPPPT